MGVKMAKKYIDSDSAFNAVLNLYAKVDDDGYCWVIRGDAARAVNDVQASDVVEVVRCKDCIYWRGENDICKGIGIDFDADGYCSEGKRKDGGQDDA